MGNRPKLFILLTAVIWIVVACDYPREQAARYEAAVYRGNGGEPGTLDPAVADDIHAFNILADLYEGLVTESSDGQLIPGTAESWTVSENGIVYEFTLDPDAKWSDGSSVVANDFVRSFRRVASPETASSYGYLLEPISGFRESLSGERGPEDIGVHAVDNRTLRITLSRPSSHLTSLLAMAVAYPEHPSGADPTITNGAFVLSSRQPGGAIALTRNPEFRDAASLAIDKVVYLPVVDLQTEFNMYRAGELDITNSVPVEFVRQELRNNNTELRVAPLLALYYLAYDNQGPPFDSIALRRALSMAIDRRQLVELLGRGESPAYSVVPPGTDNYTGTSYEWQYLGDEDRRAEARHWYTEAGYGPDNQLEARLLYDTGDVHEMVALAVQSQWRDTLGAQIELEKREWAYFLDTRTQRDEWDIMRFAWFGDYNSPMTFLEIFTSASPQNLAAYTDPEFDALLSSAGAETSPDLAALMMGDAESMLISDYPIAPLYFFVSKHLVKPHIGGFEDNVTDRHPSRFLYVREAIEER